MNNRDRSTFFQEKPGGSGGGTFVTLIFNWPLLIAGGGGGGRRLGVFPSRETWTGIPGKLGFPADVLWGSFVTYSFLPQGGAENKNSPITGKTDPVPDRGGELF